MRLPHELYDLARDAKLSSLKRYRHTLATMGYRAAELQIKQENWFRNEYHRLKQLDKRSELARALKELSK